MDSGTCLALRQRRLRWRHDWCNCWLWDIIVGIRLEHLGQAFQKLFLKRCLEIGKHATMAVRYTSNAGVLQP